MVSTSDLVTAGDVLEVVFSVPHACETLPAIPLTLEGKNLSDSLTKPILLNFIGADAKLTGHTPGAPVTDPNGDYRYTSCTECGAETAREWLCEEALAFAAHSCSFHNNLTLNYYLDASVAAQYGNLRLVLEQDVWSRERHQNGCTHRADRRPGRTGRSAVPEIQLFRHRRGTAGQ